MTKNSWNIFGGVLFFATSVWALVDTLTDSKELGETVGTFCQERDDKKV